MKIILLILTGICLTCFLSAQTNTFPSSGSVGIGTTSPTVKLDILAGDVTSSGRTQLKHGSSGIYIQQYVDLSLAEIITGNNPFHFENDGGIRMTWLANGNVGIGNTSPNYKLDVNGGVASTSYYPSLTLTAGYWGGSTFHIASGVNTADNSNGDYTTFMNPSSKGFNFRQGTNDILNISTSGNVGINTSSPSEKFSVNGNISTKKLIVTQIGWSDYVFDKDYKLRTLQQVETFIKQNNHLPEIPTAKEVEEKGISVGDNQALLLKKIEELTLYMINMDKQTKELIENNNALQKQIEQINQKLKSLQK